MSFNIPRLAALLALQLMPGMLSQPVLAGGVDATLDIKTEESGTRVDLTVIIPASAVPVPDPDPDPDPEKQVINLRSTQVSRPYAAMADLPPGLARDEAAGCLFHVEYVFPGSHAKWTGACDASGYATGAGTMRYFYPGPDPGPAAILFDGTMLRGLADGQGTILYKDGSRLEATFAYGRADGVGTMVSASGKRYVGEFRNGKQTGEARISYANLNRYEGAVVDGIPHGIGSFTRSDGRKWEGVWEKGTLKVKTYEGY